MARIDNDIDELRSQYLTLINYQLPTNKLIDLRL